MLPIVPPIATPTGPPKTPPATPNPTLQSSEPHPLAVICSICFNSIFFICYNLICLKRSSCVRCTSEQGIQYLLPHTFR